MNQQEFSKFITSLKLAIPRYAPNFEDSATLRVWYEALKDIHADDIAKTYTLLINGFSEFPAISEIREVAKIYTIPRAHQIQAQERLQLEAAEEAAYEQKKQQQQHPSDTVLASFKALRDELRKKIKG